MQTHEAENLWDFALQILVESQTESKLDFNEPTAKDCRRATAIAGELDEITQTIRPAHDRFFLPFCACYCGRFVNAYHVYTE